MSTVPGRPRRSGILARPGDALPTRRRAGRTHPVHRGLSSRPAPGPNVDGDGSSRCLADRPVVASVWTQGGLCLIESTDARFSPGRGGRGRRAAVARRAACWPPAARVERLGHREPSATGSAPPLRRRGGQLIFGTEAEEQGFRPRHRPLRRHRHPLRPHRLRPADHHRRQTGRSSPTWPSPSPRTATTRSGRSPCGPMWSSTTARRATRAAVAANFWPSKALPPHRAGGHHDQQRLGHQPAGGHRHHEAARGSPSTTTWRAASAGRSASSPTELADLRSSRPTPSAPGPFVFQTWIPNDHFTADQEPALLAAGLSLPRLRSPTSRSPTASSCSTACNSGEHRHHAHVDLPEVIRAAPDQHLARVHRRLRSTSSASPT